MKPKYNDLCLECGKFKCNCHSVPFDEQDSVEADIKSLQTEWNEWALALTPKESLAMNKLLLSQGKTAMTKRLAKKANIAIHDPSDKKEGRMWPVFVRARGWGRKHPVSFGHKKHGGESTIDIMMNVDGVSEVVLHIAVMVDHDGKPLIIADPRVRFMTRGAFSFKAH